MIFQESDEGQQDKGVQINNRKIMINTKNPRRYQELYQKATQNYYDTNNTAIEDHLNNVVSGADGDGLSVTFR